MDFDSARAVFGMNLEYSINIRCGDGGEDSEKNYNAVTILLECGQMSEVSSRVAQGLNSDVAPIKETSLLLYFQAVSNLVRVCHRRL